MRNRLIHGYDSVDLEILSRILSDDLPSLVKALEDAGVGSDRSPP